MPLILSLETATTNCSVALASDGKVIAARSINSGYSHAEKINVFIQEVIDQAGFTPDFKSVFQQRKVYVMLWISL